MTIFIDTHAHIDLPDFDEDREVVMNRAVSAGVHAIVVIGFNPERWSSTAELSLRYPNVRRAVAMHPNNADQWTDDVAATLRHELAAQDVVALGEIGLDFFRDHASRENQNRCFSDQLWLARELGLPIVIHQRAAETELLDVLRPFAPLNGVLHCFSSDTDFAHACLGLGLYLGIGGVMTYPRSDTIRGALKDVPLDRVLLETDAPYLTPQGYRGQRNEPAFVRLVAERLARDRNLDIDEVAAITTSNAITLFGPSLADAVQQRRGDQT